MNILDMFNEKKLKKDIEILKKQCHQLDRRYIEKVKENNLLREESLKKLREKNEKIQGYEEICLEQKNEIEKLKKHIEIASVESGEIKKIKLDEELEKKIDLNMEIIKYCKELKKIQDKQLKKTEILERIEKNLVEIEKIEVGFDTIENLLKLTLERIEKQENSKSVEIVEMIKSLQAKDEELDRLRKENQEYREELSKQEGERGENVEESQVEKKRIEEELDRLRIENQEYREAFEQQVDKYRQLIKEQNQEKIKNLEDKIDRLMIENREYREKLVKQADEYRENAEGQNQEEIKSLEAELDRLRRRNQDYKEELEIQEKSLELQRNEFESLESKYIQENSILKAKVFQMEIQIKKFENTEIDDENIKIMKEEIEILRDRIKKLDREKYEETEKNQILEKNLEQKEKIVAKILEDNRHYLREIEELKGENINNSEVLEEVEEDKVSNSLVNNIEKESEKVEKLLENKMLKKMRWNNYEEYSTNRIMGTLLNYMEKFTLEDFSEMYICGVDKKIVKKSQEKYFSNIIVRMKLKIAISKNDIERIAPFYKILMEMLKKEGYFDEEKIEISEEKIEKEYENSWEIGEKEEIQDFEEIEETENIENFQEIQKIELEEEKNRSFDEILKEGLKNECVEMKELEKIDFNNEIEVSNIFEAIELLEERGIRIKY